MRLLYANGTRGEHTGSWYAASAEAPGPYPALKGEVTADVAVVGGGFTGLSAALHLARAGAKVVLVEAQRVGWGASGRNGGQVAPGLNMHQDALESKLGRQAAEGYWRIGLEAVALVRKLVEELAPEADWQPGVLHSFWQEGEAREAAGYAEFLRREYGHDTLEVLDTPGVRGFVASEAYRGGVVDWTAGHIHPLAYAFGLARGAVAAGAALHEMSEVHRVAPEGGKVLVATDRGRVLADHVILGCNGYMEGLAPKVQARVMPINNYVVATEPLGARAAEVMPKNVAVADSKFVINYFRLSGDGRLIFGGGESYGYKFPADIAAKVRKPLEQVFPQLEGVRITHGWGGTLGITVKRVPAFMRVAPGVMAAGGYSGHGVALASKAGEIMARAVGGDAADFDLMARLPAPPFPGGPLLRTPITTAAMMWYAMRDRLGV
ncbi:FAD-binding oxidoreductase [Oceanicola sp. 502str15]|uniref:NAD(P)/FAD-dependent oxidoreductase n=1 Tax=Oceanicola sp. 502str15 TaxID=2696061 RepID=UPI002094C890|nr:FAD-binding oxidoreductase [Oceanicola sp. 502str15]MCO6382979.1 FAD-dependent oxidoreductase [Oceanicola sp. 502str15]